MTASGNCRSWSSSSRSFTQRSCTQHHHPHTGEINSAAQLGSWPWPKLCYGWAPLAALWPEHTWDCTSNMRLFEQYEIVQVLPVGCPVDVILLVMTQDHWMVGMEEELCSFEKNSNNNGNFWLKGLMLPCLSEWAFQHELEIELGHGDKSVAPSLEVHKAWWSWGNRIDMVHRERGWWWWWWWWWCTCT